MDSDAVALPIIYKLFFNETPKLPDYPTYEITLHSVSNGNFQTKSSNKNEFFNNK